MHTLCILWYTNTYVYFDFCWGIGFSGELIPIMFLWEGYIYLLKKIMGGLHLEIYISNVSGACNSVGLHTRMPWCDSHTIANFCRKMPLKSILGFTWLLTENLNPTRFFLVFRYGLLNLKWFQLSKVYQCFILFALFRSQPCAICAFQGFHSCFVALRAAFQTLMQSFLLFSSFLTEYSVCRSKKKKHSYRI